MKITLLLIILTILSACSKSDNMSLDSELNKNSYAIGKKIGENLKSQEISVNIESLKSGIEDSFSGKSKLSDDEIKKTLINLNSKSNQDHDEEFDKNIEIGRAFLKENKLNKKVLEFKDGIQMITNKEGSGKQLTLDTLIKISYSGTLINKQEFESNTNNHQQPVLSVLNKFPILLHQSLLLMKQGGSYTVFIPAELAYGRSSRPGIPAGSTLIYNIEILEVK